MSVICEGNGACNYCSYNLCFLPEAIVLCMSKIVKVKNDTCLCEFLLVADGQLKCVIKLDI